MSAGVALVVVVSASFASEFPLSLLHANNARHEEAITIFLIITYFRFLMIEYFQRPDFFQRIIIAADAILSTAALRDFFGVETCKN